MRLGERLIVTCATFRRELGSSGAQVATVLVGAQGQFRVEIHSAFQMPTILSALRLSNADEARAIRAVNTGETVTVEGRTCVGDLLCVGFLVTAGEMGRLQAA